MVTTTSTRLLLLVALLASLVGCRRSDEELQQDLDAFVAERNSCQADEDCVVVYTECPLGCGHAVTVGEEEEVSAHADALVLEAGMSGQVCAYDCLELFARCDSSGHCQAVAEGG